MSDFQDKITESAPQPRQNDAQDRERVREPQDKMTGTPPPHQVNSLSEAPRPATLQVEYTLILEDAAAFYRYDIKFSPWVRRWAGVPSWVWLVFVGMALTVGVLTRLMVPHMRSFDLFDGLMGVVLVWLLFRVVFGGRLKVRRALRAVRRNPGFFQRNTVTISPEGLSWSDPSGGKTTPWHAIVEIVTHGEHAFFYKAERKATILPQRAFADRRLFEQFVNTARRYHAEVHRFIRTEGQP